MTPPVSYLGETALFIDTQGPGAAQQWATLIRSEALEGVEDVVPAASSVGVIVDPCIADICEVATRVLALATATATTTAEDSGLSGRSFDIEVCFDGPDLDAVAASSGLGTRELVSVIEAASLRVGWLGFMPGFAYLLGLPAPLDSLPRLDRPRTRLAAGSVALAGGYAGIYPLATPGGWNVLGRTGFRLFDASIPPFATLMPGDAVRFRSVRSIDGQTTDAADCKRRPLTTEGSPHVKVLEAGLLTTVQDAGRIGVAHLGVPRAGPADPMLHAIANVAVGNRASAPALEITASGPKLHFGCATFVALAGDCALWIDGKQMPPGSVQRVEQGQVVKVGAMVENQGASQSAPRSYLGIAGGVLPPAYFGSCSSDTFSGIGAGILQAGDELEIGRQGRPRGRFVTVRGTQPAVLRVTPGPDARGRGIEILASSEWVVSKDSDRTGTRLERLREPDRLAKSPTIAGTVASRVTVTGAVQLPPDGRPIILGPDHGTVGGYEIAGVVTQACLPLAGQLRPGTVVRFEEASPIDSRQREPVTSSATLAQLAVSGWLESAPGHLS